MSKYKSRKISLPDGTFDSQLEAAHWQALKARQHLGEISGLTRQVAYLLAEAVTIQGRRRPALKYLADFVYRDNSTGQTVVADAKGVMTEGYRIKRHLLKATHGIDILELGRASKVRAARPVVKPAAMRAKKVRAA